MMTTKPTVTGRITFYGTVKRYGFCVPSGVSFEERDSIASSAVRFRRSGLTSLAAGQRISFRMQEPKARGRKPSARTFASWSIVRDRRPPRRSPQCGLRI